jgi:hypothetical protein
MDESQAYNLVKQICEAQKMSYAEHGTVQQALQIIASGLFKKDEEEIDGE